MICVKCRPSAKKNDTPYLNKDQANELIEREVTNRLVQANEAMVSENESLKRTVEELKKHNGEYGKRFIGIESINKQQQEQIRILLERN